METKLIDGKQIAREVRAELKEKIRIYTEEQGLMCPKMAVILVGEDPASEVYVRNKGKACGWIKMESQTLRLPSDTSEGELIRLIETLNLDDSVNGILVQLPLPGHIHAETVLMAIDPAKDVDGFHIYNAGRLYTGISGGLVPCTPAGIVQMIKRSGYTIEGKHCVVAGRSNIVGKPAAMLMLKENATVTICHSRTQDLKFLTRQADILIAAVGRPKMFGPQDIKEGAIVIDVGIHRLEGGLCGDTDYQAMIGKAAAVTPVPGGVGPMTIAMLLSNCLKAYEQQLGLPS